MKTNFYIKQGLIFSLVISQSALAVRFNHQSLGNLPDLIFSQFALLLICILCWIGICLVLQNLSQQRFWLKIFECAILCVCVSFLIFLVSPYQYYPFQMNDHTSTILEMFRVIYRGLVMGLLMIPIAHYFYEVEKVEQEKVDIEKLKQQNLMNELTILREQLNPHFLFNSLNVLKSGTKDGWVKNFTIRLSNVYRYLLKLDSDMHLITVASELDFIYSYVHILEERFEDGLKININIDEQYYNYKIPPLALQLLIENAIKHNVISLQHPLSITIVNDGNTLIISNSIRLKKVTNLFMEKSRRGIGLNNLNSRYQLIANERIIIEHSDKFKVKIPMIA